MKTSVLKISGGAVLLAALVFVAFQPALDNGFTNWDDPKYVTENILIRRIDPVGIRRMLNPHYGSYKPVVLFSLAANYRFAGLNPRPYHATNILLHCANALLVLVFLYQIGKDFPAAVLAAALFAVHPLRVESVAWVTERKDLLFAFFLLVSMLFYLSYLNRSRKIFFAFSLAAFLFSLAAKPQGVTLPFILLLIDYYRRRKMVSRILTEKLPFLLLAGAALVLNLVAWGNFVGFEPAAAGGAISAERFSIPVWGIGFYLAKTVFPFQLSAFYPSPTFNLPGLAAAGFGFAFLILTALSFRRRRLFFGNAFFLLALAPVIQLLPTGPAAAADRYTYLPSIGLFFLAGLLVSRLSRSESIVRPLRHISFAAAGAIVLLLIPLTRSRCRVWRDSLSLWNDVLDKLPELDLAWNNRGLAWAEMGEWHKAVEDYNRAIEIEPRVHLPYTNRGMAWARLGRLDRALADLNRAISLNPRAARALANRGAIHQMLGMEAAARADYDRTLGIDPNDYKTYFNRGQLNLDTGRWEEAREDFTRAIGFDPGDAQSFYYRGLAHQRLGLFGRARQDYLRALQLQPDREEPARALREIERIERRGDPG